MKHSIHIAIIAAAALCLSDVCAATKKINNSVTYSNLQVNYNNATGNIDLSFDASISFPGTNYCLVVTPIFTKEGKDAPANSKLAMMPSYAMEGDWYSLSRKRKQRSGIKFVIPERPVFVLTANSYTYKTSIPQRNWVDNVSMSVYTTLRTYSGAVDQTVFRFSGLLTLSPGKDELYEETKSAASLPFVERVNNINRPIVNGTATMETVEDYIENHGEGSLTVHFETGSSNINPDFMWNRESLSELADAIKEMKATSSEPRVVIVGYSSPEGSNDRNKRLSTERARSVQEYITLNTELMLSEIAVYDGGVNWLGLKRLIAADNSVPMKDEILAILEQPIWNVRTQTGRLSSLMRLGGGEPYRYMLNNYFPQLRGAAFIKVFYSGL